MTLIFLTVQLRQGTVAVRSAATQAVQDQIANIYGAMATDSDLTEIYVRGTQHPSKLSVIETGRFMAFLTISLTAYQNMYFQKRSGAYDEHIFDGWIRLLANASCSPGFQAFWEQRSYMFSTDFRRYVESEVFNREIPGHPPLSMPADQASGNKEGDTV